jgi:hypothetical protein
MPISERLRLKIAEGLHALGALGAAPPSAAA